MTRRADDSENWGGARVKAGRKPEGEEKKETVSVSLDRSIVRQVREEALKRDLSVSALVEMALKAFMDKE